MKKILFFLTLGVTIISCTKSKDESFSKMGGVKHPYLRVDSLDASNSNNPYDNIGLQHNESCAFILSQDNLTKDNFSSNWIAETQNTLQGFTSDELSYASNVLTSDSWKSCFQDNTPFVPNDSTQTATHLLANNLISNNAYGFLIDLYSKVDELDSNIGNNDISLDSEYVYFKNQIITIETSVENSNLNDYEKKTILASSSVCRYSAAFWIQKLSGIYTDGGIPQGKVNHYVKSDLNGAAAASVGWGVYGAIAGGAVGWGATVISGGVANSVLEWLNTHNS